MGIPFEEIMKGFTPERRAKIEARAAEMIAETQTLAELRKAQKLTQRAVAKKLGIKQESVSTMESRADMLISTLRNYVKVMGGELSLNVKFKDRPPVELSTLRSSQKPGRKTAGQKSARKAKPAPKRLAAG
jgi:transcriptional regulator with XRE-family HTH domain